MLCSAFFRVRGTVCTVQGTKRIVLQNYNEMYNIVQFQSPDECLFFLTAVLSLTLGLLTQSIVIQVKLMKLSQCLVNAILVQGLILNDFAYDIDFV